MPSGEKHTLETSYECHLNDLIKIPTTTSQIITDLSMLPVTNIFPSGEKHTQVTAFVCSLKGFPTFYPVFTSQINASESLLPVTIRLPSWEKLTQVTLSV